jgi:hypothetical protein
VYADHGGPTPHSLLCRDRFHNGVATIDGGGDAAARQTRGDAETGSADGEIRASRVPEI